MNEFEKNKQKIELIKKARQLLNQEYIEQRAKDYTNWETACNIAWKTSGTKLPFPSIPPMPTEEDVVARALVLYNEMYPPVVSPPVEEPMTQPTEQPEKTSMAVDASSTDVISDTASEEPKESIIPEDSQPKVLNSGQQNVLISEMPVATHQAISPWYTYLTSGNKTNKKDSSLIKE